MSDIKSRKVGKNGIEISETLGIGSYGRVYSGVWDKRKVAVKRLDSSKETHEEISMLREVDHSNVVKYLYTDEEGEFFYIVLEKCVCTLQQVVNGEKEDVSLPRVEILRQVTFGLDYLHNVKNLVHRDLKPSNILLIFKDKIWNVKISDFGISKPLSQGKTSITQTSRKGTDGYVAPEILKGEKIRKESDIFSLGIVFYYVLSNGEHPFGDDQLKIQADIRDGVKKTSLDSLNDNVSHLVKTLILSMIAHEWKDRLNIHQVMAHHLFWNAQISLDFFQEVSDYLEDCVKHKDLIERLEDEMLVPDVVGGNWQKKLEEDSEVIRKIFEKRRQDEGTSQSTDDMINDFQVANKRRKVSEKVPKLQILLCLVRNWKNDYNTSAELEQLRKEVGDLPEKFLQFFTSKFPKLLPYVYDVMKSESKQPHLKKFYSWRKEDRHYMAHMAVTEYSNTSPGLDGTLPQKGVKEVNPEKKKKLKLRVYQDELAEQALAGENSLIIAPTGSGKTAVACAIIQKHLSIGQGRCMFFVSKTTLAFQQHSFFQQYLDHSVTHLIGDSVTNAPPGQIMKDNKITVLTPQILINELERTPAYISFDDISLMVFDECHHTSKRHPYNIIMEMLLDYQTSNPKHKPMQIVGLTASPGVGKGNSREKVKLNLITLLANLNIMIIPSVVVKNSDALKKHQKNVEKVYIRVKTEDNEFTNKVSEVMNDLESCIRDIIGTEEWKNCAPPAERNSQDYENWTADITNRARSDDKWSKDVIIYARHLKMYCTMLQLSDVIPNAVEICNKKVHFGKEGELNAYLREKNKEVLDASGKVKVQVFEELLRILKSQFRKDPETRCIIFVSRKVTPFSLVEFLNKENELKHLGPRPLTSAHESSDDGGMTKSVQEKSISLFKSGKSQILISTSVAEEGLDIPQCNLVIMYNYVTGEVGKIQRARRCRASNGKLILIATANSKHVEREKMNKACANATEQAIEDMRKISADELKRQVSEIQESQRQDRQRKREETAAELKTKSKGEPGKWKIYCRDGCPNLITSGDKLRHIDDMHVVVIDPNFKDHVFRKECQKKKGPLQGTADFLCLKCNQKLALEIFYDSKYYPTLSIRKILVKNDDGEKQCPLKKKDLPFTIDRGIKKSAVKKDPVTSTGASVNENSSLDLDVDDIIETLENENYQ